MRGGVIAVDWWIMKKLLCFNIWFVAKGAARSGCGRYFIRIVIGARIGKSFEFVGKKIMKGRFYRKIFTGINYKCR